jgi:NitT/TauT family transport system substrate-binding protein
MIAVAVVAVLALGGIAAWALLATRPPPADALEPLTVAWAPFESTALFWVAEDRQFFAGNGLCLSLRRYDSGAATLDAIANGDAGIAVGSAEYPLVRQAFANGSARAIACIDRAEFIYLVGRKDRGIGTVEDLRGKRVGTTVGTIAEFHLVRYLDLHGMSLEDITLVDLRTPAEWVNATAEGTVDAIATSQPYADAARERLGENAVAWSIQSDQPFFALVAATEDWLGTHPETARRFLAALAEAEEYLDAHPAESGEILRQRLDLDPGYKDTVQKQNRFSLSLDQALVVAMEDEARWMIATNMTNATAIPDFREFIDTTALGQVRPDAVRIIG